MSMFGVVGSNIEAMKVYRSPFEHLTTADAQNGAIFTVVQVVGIEAPVPNWLAPRPAPAIDPLFERTDWLSDLLNQVQIEMVEDVSDQESAQRALADSRNKVRVPFDEVRKRLEM